MDKKIFLYIALGIIILGLLFFTIFPNMVYAIKDNGMFGASAQDATDKCHPPEGSGMSQDDWNTHMSHHPDIYKDCFS